MSEFNSANLNAAGASVRFLRQASNRSLRFRLGQCLLEFSEVCWPNVGLRDHEIDPNAKQSLHSKPKGFHPHKVHFIWFVDFNLSSTGTLVSVFLLGGASFLARYYRFISRSKQTIIEIRPVIGDSPFDRRNLELCWPKGTESARKSLRIGDIWCPWLGFSWIVRGTRSGARPGRRPLARASDRVRGQWSELFF